MKSLKSAILTTPKWAVVDISDFNYTKLYCVKLADRHSKVKSSVFATKKKMKNKKKKSKKSQA